MSQETIIGVLRDAIYTVIVAAAPMLIVAMVVGLIVSIFQATTQINEQTLAFVPKIVAILLTILIFGGLIMTTLRDFTLRLYATVNSVTG
ncbi:MAG: flagellar biosynthesis protein FliQ [Oscillospiraceae bacterium]|nr:flagellar biosynthesis protein FliQ [Oscillospiraceae bacterium]